MRGLDSKREMMISLLRKRFTHQGFTVIAVFDFWDCSSDRHADVARENECFLSALGTCYC